ncbi:hypothetical protein E2C01_093322 [Portunus trituberculatus]|uniref:Uncharacterized protein n=1 Tax=Portunus trituberculatus TaxID=210409 RepID=A0A5B7JTN9_PORTR|nr:hypothetical protein [Portunus trituberculatus]
MRGGRLLAETSPYSLIEHFGIPSLEDIFLKLCLENRSGEDELLHGKPCLNKSSAQQFFVPDLRFVMFIICSSILSKSP